MILTRQLPDDLPAKVAAALGGVSYKNMNRPWRSRSHSTNCNWVTLTRYAVGERPLLELWEIASCLYAACAARVIGGTRFKGDDVGPLGWASTASLLRDFLKSKPEHAMNRREWRELHPRMNGTKGRRL